MKQLFTKPIIVIGCSRSGTTLLFRNLSEHPDTWSLYEESFPIFYRYYPVHPELGDYVAELPSPEIADAIRLDFYREVHNKEVFAEHSLLGRIPRKVLQRPIGRLYKRPPLRLVEKTPANCIRIPLLAHLFPEARFLYIVRRPEAVVSSLMEGWKNWSRTGSGPWRYTQWHYLAPPGWRGQVGRPLPEICAFQWIEANRIASEDLERCCADRHLLVRHEDAIEHPQRTYARVLDFCELRPSRHLDRLIAESHRRQFTHGGSPPEDEKWKRLHRDEVESVRHLFQPLMERFYPEALVA